MTEVRSLGNDIYELMLANVQNNIVQSIWTSASYGSTSCVVSSKGATEPFLDQLQIQGVDYIELGDEKIKLFWEGLQCLNSIRWGRDKSCLKKKKC